MRVGIRHNDQKQVHNLSFDVGAQLHVLAVNTVQNGFQIVALARVLRIEQLKERLDK